MLRTLKYSLVVPALATGRPTADVDEARKDLERDLYGMLPSPSPAKTVQEAS